MNKMMTFPNTWEEFEKLYGFNDVEKIYTNNSRLIPSFRVKQWLDHLLSIQPNIPNTNVEELINRQAAIEAIISKPAWHNSEGSWYHGSDIRQALKELSPAQPKKGKWVKTYRDGFGNLIGYCNKCGRRYPVDNFCPNCGADMREGDSKWQKVT